MNSATLAMYLECVPDFRYFTGKLVDRRGVVAMPRLEFGGREIGMVRRVRKVLCLQAERVTMVVNFAVFARDRAVQEVSGVELHSRLQGCHIHQAAALRFVDFGGLVHGAHRAIENEVVYRSLCPA